MRSPSFSSTSSRFTPPSVRSLSCWRTAEAKDSAPPGSAVLASIPPSSAGQRLPGGLLRGALVHAEACGEVGERDAGQDVVDGGHGRQR
jgi:hypothetical protein